MNKLYYYNDLVNQNSSQFSDLILPDSLKENYMLYIPKKGCSLCLDSAVMILSEYKREHPKFNYFIFSHKNKYLMRYIRYHRIQADILESAELRNYDSKVTYPLLAYYTNDCKFIRVYPLLKEHTKPFRRYLDSLEF